ncbi:MAG: penicillin-binding protein 2 [Chitinophagaceae bacterium]|nr:penicillin-binding protein 2 [Chitinophagaceae bacterium]
MPVYNQSRNRFIKIIIALTFLIITVQLFKLQILPSRFQQMARENAIFAKIKYPERGIIYDRNGKAILNNIISYDLVVTPSETKGLNVPEFCSLLQIDTAEYNKKIAEAVFKNTALRPSVFLEQLSPLQKARFEENSWKFPGFTLVERPVRTFPYHAAAHILGYVREVDQKDIERSGNFYRQGDYIGKTGLEAYYEKILMGIRGVEYWIKDNKNRLVAHFEKGAYDTPAVAGRALKTYLDIELQQLAEKLMSNKLGGLVAIEPSTGGILAMVSGPTYNPNDLTGAQGGKNFARLQLDVTGPLLNRAINGLYEPGSTFKPLGALVALDEGLITPSYGYPCGGRYRGCGTGKPRCTHSGGGHSANLRNAIAYSCNSYFTHLYRLAVDNPKYKNVKVGYMKWREYMNLFGLGVRLGVDLPSENKGNIPDTTSYNRQYKGEWNSCTNLTLGIGQDQMQATPLQLANAMCIIANRGYYYTPHFVKSIEDETMEDSSLMNPFRKKHEVLTHIPDSAYEAVIDGMYDVVRIGTARVVNIPGIKICAKTGTAENYTIIHGRRVKLQNNSLFVCFAPKDTPKIAIAVCVQNAGYGAKWAGPIAKILIEKYLTDTLRKKTAAEAERISKAKLIPPHYRLLQYQTDSVRAYEWFKMTKDSSHIKKFRRQYWQDTTTSEPKLENEKNNKPNGKLYRKESDPLHLTFCNLNLYGRSKT